MAKQCFIICPIGEDESETRKRSDKLLKYIIEPALKECGYDPKRADQISKPGIITKQIIERIIEDPLVIADLTEHNPNVFYELAIRHVIKKPLIQMIHTNDSIPFDVATSRTIKYDLDVELASKAQKELVAQIKAAEENPDEPDNPISIAVNWESLKKSKDPQSAINTEIISLLDDLREQMGSLTGEIKSIKNFLRPPSLIERYFPPRFPVMGGALRRSQSHDPIVGSIIRRPFNDYIRSQQGAEENISEEKKSPPKPKDTISDEGQD